MVKEATKILNLTKYLTTALLDEEIDLAIHLSDFIDLLQENTQVSNISLINLDGSQLYSGTKNTISEFDIDNPKNLNRYEIFNWGYLYTENSENYGDKFWADICSHLGLFIHSAELKQRSHLVSQLTSDIRKTLKPDLALEKIYNGFRDYEGIKDIYFFKRLVNEDDTYSDIPEQIFKGYSLYFHNGERKDIGSNNASVINKKVIGFDEVSGFDYIEDQSDIEIFSSKVRGREWGVFVINRNGEWTSELKEIFMLFSEQLATVFSQHELHSESLTTAQREFLLNQITTKIRESLKVDKIIETAVQEIGQVMGVESCGLLILDKRIKGTMSQRSWSIKEEFDSAMSESLYSIIETDLEPNYQQASVPIVFKENNPSSVERLSNLGFRSYLTCGLFNETTKELVGILSIAFFSHERFWSHDEKLLLEGACRQLENALTQASIYQEAQQTRRQMALLHKLSNDIRDSLDISIVLGQIAKGIGEVLGLSRCFVRRFSDDHMILRTEEEYAAPGYAKTADLIFAFERDWIKKLDEQKDISKSFEILNIQSMKDEFNDAHPDLLKIAGAIQLKSYLAVPLVARGKILGTINVHQCDRERMFLPEEIEFIFRVGSEAAIALEHAALFDTINTYNKTDPDTGVYNKRYFKEIAEDQIAKARDENRDISFMLIDVDHLKEINDDTEHGGHDAGDEAIQVMANVLAKTVRQTPVDELNKRIADVVARFGGDEFMVLLPNTNLEGAMRVAERIRYNLERSKLKLWHKPLTCSMGIAGSPHDLGSFDELRNLADRALYLSKGKGRDAYSSTLELKP